MTGKPVKWTGQQQEAIAEHRRNVLVTASAGTGKTAVLSGSCASVVSDTGLCPDVWSILVLTFTDMAAQQMRRRIAEQLRASLQQSGDEAIRRHLRHQLVLLAAADISTIHSFCRRLISEHFYKLQLDPTFAIVDADEAGLLKQEVLEKTIDWAWQQADIAAPLSELLARRDLRTADGFLGGIIGISDFLDSAVSRDDWCRRAAAMAQSGDPFGSDLAEGQRQIIAARLQDAVNRVRHAQGIYNRAAGDAAGKFDREYIRGLTGLLEPLQAGDWTGFISELETYAKPRVSTPKDIDKELGELIHDTVKEAVDSVGEVRGMAILNPSYLDRLAGAVSRQTMVLIKLVAQFERFYAQAKKAVNCLDFADLEHYALKLLVEEQSPDDAPQPTPTAMTLRSRYKYIFVDEYQDINRVQQTILRMLSSEGNVFAVGDAKQSIYEWRGARPDVFLEDLSRASTRPAGPRQGLRVDLNINFRSVRGILDFANKVFGRIMTRTSAKIDYDESARLRAASETQACAGCAVELHILDKAQGDGRRNDDADDDQPDGQSGGSFDGKQLQAAMIAQRIRQIVGADTGRAEFEIPDKGTNSRRPVRYGDIVILMRSPANKTDFVRVLRLAGIPVSCEAVGGYFEATEITDMLCLLKVLDNSRRDIELAAVLRSPVFNVTDSQLAAIRLLGKAQNREADFYSCVTAYADAGGDPALAAVLRNILKRLDGWRTTGRRGRLADRIWQIYRETGVLSFVSALPAGQARRANLLRLHDRAIQFEGFVSSAGIPSLRRFIDFIEKLISLGQDWSAAEPQSAASNAVGVLSVHKSKGLEFPVVIVADLDAAFSSKDSRRDMLLDERWTLGLRVVEPLSNARLDSMAYQVIREKARRTSLAEEMRILYVAMTRATQRLILVGSTPIKPARKLVTTASFFGRDPIPDWHLARCSSHIDWLLCALSDEAVLHRRLETSAATDTTDESLFDLHLYDQSALAGLGQYIRGLRRAGTYRRRTTGEKAGPGSSAQLLARLKQSIGRQYPFGPAPSLPAKRSVSQWTHRNDEFTKIDYSMSLNRLPKALLTAEQVESLDGRLIGTATHLLISQLDLARPVTTKTVAALLDKLVAADAVSPPVACRVDVDSIVAFFDGDLGRTALNMPNSVLREWPFTFAVPASQWPANDERQAPSTASAGDETIIVQGIIDMLIRAPAGLLVIDFKTDNVTAPQLAERANLYRRQLQLYAQAASAILGEKVSKKSLYFLRPRREVEV